MAAQSSPQSRLTDTVPNTISEAQILLTDAHSALCVLQQLLGNYGEGDPPLSPHGLYVLVHAIEDSTRAALDELSTVVGGVQ